jgi:carbonic anhydrase/acetyltransferase-like protein (isoleucine patch superfamily)
VPTLPYLDHRPSIDPTAFVAPGAWVIGEVTLGASASVWYGAVLRGDADRIEVGARSNVQDGAVLHVDAGRPCAVGEDCTIGHRAVVHGCTVGRGSLVGMGAVVLSGATIGEESLVGAGALVPEGRTFAPRSLIIGHPARLIRVLSDEEVERLIRPGVRNYLEYAAGHRAAEEEDR